MGLGRLRRDDGERLDQTLPATCLGETCEFYAGAPCDSYEDLLQAAGKKSGNTDKPPLKEDATYALYGQVCVGADPEALVALRAEIMNDGVNPMMLVAQAGRYGDLPLTIPSDASSAEITTFASSD